MLPPQSSIPSHSTQSAGPSVTNPCTRVPDEEMASNILYALASSPPVHCPQSDLVGSAPKSPMDWTDQELIFTSQLEFHH